MKKSILLLLLALVAYGISSINSKDSADEKDIQNNVNTSAKGYKKPKVDSTISYELPAPLTNRQEQIVEHTGYTLSYNKDHNTPNWSAWMLTKEKTEGTVERCRKFWADPKISQLYRVDYFDYKGSGYDRGHMCPAGDMKWSEAAMHDCFFMSNMCPQEHALNNGSWKNSKRHADNGLLTRTPYI